MKYIKLAFQYAKGRNFWKLALITVIPSLLFSFIASFSNVAKFFINFFDYDLKSFNAIFKELTDLTWGNLLLMILSLIIIAVIVSIFIGTMQRHMRTGKFAVKNIFKRINENFLPTVLSLVLTYILIFIFGFFVSLFVTFWFAVTKIKLATLILSAFFALVIFIFMVYLMALFSLSAPFMVTTGSSVFSSASSSIRNARHHIKDIFVAIILPLLPLFALEYAVALLDFKPISVLVDTLFFSFLMSYYPVLIFVTYYDIQQLDREDLLPVNRM